MFPTLQAASCIAGEFFTAVNSLEVCKGTWNSSLLKKMKFWEDGIMKLPEKWQKVVGQNNMLFNKVIGESGRCVFYFY